MSGEGGAIHTTDPFNSSPVITNNIVYNNFGIGCGGIYESNPGAHIVGNLVFNNEGSGIRNGHGISHGMVLNNTVCNNSRSGILIGSPYLNVINNIVWNNTKYDQPSQIDSGNWSPTVEYNTIMEGHNGEGNIDSDPLFVNPISEIGIIELTDSYDWSLLDNSPSINRGMYDTANLPLTATDAYGQPRVFGNRIDMGAIENQVIIDNIEKHNRHISRLTVYPNPATNHINFSVDDTSTESEVKILSSDGRIVYSHWIYTSNLQNQKIDISTLRSGVYIINITTKENLWIGKFIKN
ncbi:MAG: T9SS type A sorting domain-containing protein [Bacteroidales bacterium]|nr:T9SS type A sorting domain-containing protein [Bacteroidales bacterium]